VSTVLFNITHGFQARMLLRSTVAEHLAVAGVRIVVVSPNADEQYFRDELQAKNMVLERMPVPRAGARNRFEREMVAMRQSLLMDPALGATLNYKNEVFRRTSPARWGVARAGNQLLGRLPMLRRAYITAEGELFDGREFDSIVERHRPALIVTGTPGVDLRDAHVMRAARRWKIQTATVMLSWDNLTSKGYMSAIPDHMLVWSELMAEEAAQYHGYPRDRAIWCGAAQFDHYHRFRETFDSAGWRAQHGIPSRVALIVYGTINPAILPHEIEIVRTLVRQVRDGAFGRPAILWVRLHPQMVKGPFATALDGFLALRGQDVVVEVPPVISEKLNWDLPADDRRHLAALLAAADVLVTTSSTLVIDAACLGTPIVNVFFDGADAPGHLAARRFKRYTHYEKVLRTGGIAVADTPQEFAVLARRYIEDPRADRDGRLAIISQQLRQLDGKAGERTARALTRLCGHRSN
jgi:hypothetical protein